MPEWMQWLNKALGGNMFSPLHWQFSGEASWFGAWFGYIEVQNVCFIFNKVCFVQSDANRSEVRAVDIGT